MEEKNIHINDRVRIQGHRGTVRFVGGIDSMTGLFYGIDWDDQARGKHDGTFNGVRYFSARTPSSGSFVKVSTLIKVGKTLLHCFNEKYEYDKPGDVAKVESFGSKKIEYVGLDGVQSRNIRSLVFDDTDVSIVDKNDFFTAFPLLCEIHLVNTLMNDWNEVFKLCDQIEHLNFLNLSRNIFDWSRIEANVYPKMTTLILNEAALNSEHLESIVAWFPNLSRFDASKNLLDSVSSLCNWEHLKELDISFNFFNDWRNTKSLGCLNSLQQLNLGNNQITNIFVDQDTFKSLKILNMSNNTINEWSSVDELDKLIAMENLNLSANPVSDLELSRPAIICRVRKLKVLNKCEITITERINAEEIYFKICEETWNRVDGDETKMTTFLRDHPKFAKHYKSTSEKKSDFESQRNKGHLIDLIFKCEGRESVRRKVSGEATILKLRFIVSRLFGEPPLKIKLNYENSNRTGVVLPLDNDTRNLTFYSLRDGDSIFVCR